MQLSEGTVRTTSRPAIGKMGARTRADAVRIALPADPPAEGLTVILRRA